MASQSSDETPFAARVGALLSLCGVSTCIGVTMKVAQVQGKYKFSPSSAVVMTEMFKFVVSCLMILQICVRSVLSNNNNNNNNTVADSAHQQQATESDNDEKKKLNETAVTTTIHSEDSGFVGKLQRELMTFLRQNLSHQLVAHAAGLAVAYAVVNIVTYAIMIHAPASSFFLLKAGSPVVTAFMLKGLVGRDINSVQWLSIVMQCVGLVVTQYNPCTNSTQLTVLAYVLILINVAVSCGAGVWNEHIIKSYGASVNVQNAVLYLFGMIVCFITHHLLPSSLFGAQGSLGFFEGYTPAVFGVIMANGMVGLVITAVYKYADVVVKTFGIASSTALIYVLEKLGFLPGAHAAMSAVFGAVVVFYASYLYIAPPLSTSQEQNETGASFKQFNNHRTWIMLTTGLIAVAFAFSSSC